MLLHSVSYARAGLLGNPYDGYFGKTIAFSIGDFSVDLMIYESPDVQFSSLAMLMMLCSAASTSWWMRSTGLATTAGFAC